MAHAERRSNRPIRRREVAVTTNIQGSTIGRYRIIGELGRGGMAVVYRAARHDGAIVALKVMAPELARTSEFRDRFIRESQLVIAHPHIVPVYEAGVADDQLYIAMHLVDGCDLKGLIRRERRLPPARVLPILKQAADALDAAHAEGLVHRDVKPQNFLLETAVDPSENFHVYLSDFGLVKRVAGQTSLTRSAHLVGTAQYMSPEQIRGQQLDGRTDVYALGCVLYECLSGSPPFSADEEVAVLWGHVHEDPPPLSEMVPILPDALDAVLAKALAKDPQDRHLTAGDLAEEFEQVVAPSQRRHASGWWNAVDVPTPPRRLASAKPVEQERSTRRGILGWIAAVVFAAFALVAVLTDAGERLPSPITLPELVERVGGTDVMPSPASATDQQTRASRPRTKRDREPDQLVADLRAALPPTIDKAREERRGQVVPPSSSQGGAASEGATIRVAPHPTSGSYVYAQTGHEQICPEGRSCLSGRSLPDTREVRVAQAARSTTPVVITTAGVSSRFAYGSSIRYGYRAAHLQDMQMSFDTEFGSFTVRLEPQPLIDWLAFPLSRGSRWSGSWESSSPGRYVIEVLGVAKKVIAGRRVDAVRLRSELDWAGQHPGKMSVVWWVARETRVPLESAGTLRVETNVDGYHYDVSFTTRLRSGPGFGG